MEKQVEKEGWFLSEKGFAFCKNICSSDTPSKNEIIRNALHADIKEIGRQILPADISKGKITEINGPLVLQIQKIKNISAPNAKEDSSVAPRMLRIHLTDGVIHCTAIEIEPIQSISLSTPPGTKICLNGNINLDHGFILLSPNCFKVLGGEVHHLISKWEISQNVSKLQRKVLMAEGGPPLFVPFDESSFANRKPQPASSVKIKETPLKPPQKTKATTNPQEKATKAPEPKKIWKSEEKNPRKKRENEKTEILTREDKVKSEEQNKPPAKRNQNQNKKDNENAHESEVKSQRLKDPPQSKPHDYVKRDLPPRLEKLRHNQKEERFQTSGYNKPERSSSDTANDSKKDTKIYKKKDVVGDMEQVVDLIDKRMKIDEQKGARYTRGDQKGTRSNYEKDRNNTRNFDRDRRNFQDKGRDRNERYPDRRDKGSSNAEGRAGNYQAKGRNDYSDSNRDHANRPYKKGNDRNEAKQQHQQFVQLDNKNIRTDGQGNVAKNQNAPVQQQLPRGNNSDTRSSKQNGLQRQNSSGFEANAVRKNDKVTQFISQAATANPGFMPQMAAQTGAFVVESPQDVAFKQTTMQNPILQQPSMQQSNIQRFPQTTYTHQQMMTTSAQLIYVPPYPTDAYQSTFTQAYPMPANQEYQQATGQGYQAQIHGMTQYQPSPSSAVYIQNTAIHNQVVQQQNYQLRGHFRPRVRHDIYRPKQ